jgi:hypothetical protein
VACSGQSDRAVSRRRRALGMKWLRARSVGGGGVEACSVSGRGDGGSVEDLKRASGENLVSVERAAHIPDIYIGGQMRDARSVRHVSHFFSAPRIIFR